MIKIIDGTLIISIPNSSPVDVINYRTAILTLIAEAAVKKDKVKGFGSAVVYASNLVCEMEVDEEQMEKALKSPSSEITESRADVKERKLPMQGAGG